MNQRMRNKVSLSIEEKVKAVDDINTIGLAVGIPKYKIDYKTFVQWKKEAQEYGKSAGKKEKLLVTSKVASSILTAGKGFMDEYDYTLNPYSGCTFGCTYCYAAFFSRTAELQNSWGHWLHIKENALDLLKKFRKKTLSGKTIYMSSVTDPYQPIEREINLTRSILEELSNHHNPRLVIQTRSPLVTRDIDLFQRFDAVQINMTITTDSETVRKVFEPLCPSNALRLKAIKEVHQAGINACITMTPLLPIEHPTKFAQSLLDTGIKKYIIQPFHSEKGKFVGGTRDKAMTLVRKMNWSRDKYESVLKILVKHIPNIGLGKDGFKPI